MSLAFAAPTEWWLEIPSHIQAECWQASQVLASPSCRQRFYLNQLCLNVFLPWFQQEYAPEAQVWPDANGLLSIWEMVNGSSLTLDSQRIVLLPTDALEGAGLDVPQEWVDIPNWVADYYIVIQIDLDEGWIRAWGYTTHHALKQSAKYDAVDRTYCLPAQEVNRDLNSFWTICQLCPDAQTKDVSLSSVQAVVPLSAVQQAIQRLSRPETLFPRLAIPFPVWAALLSNPDWRQHLYQNRLAAPQTKAHGSRTNGVTDLNGWFADWCAEGWQTLETFLGEEVRLVPRRVEGMPDGLCRQRIKFITLKVGSEQQTLALLIVLSSEADGRTKIRTQIHPRNRDQYLPSGLILAMYSGTDERLQKVQSTAQEDYMRLPQFRCLPGTQFRLQVTFHNDTFSETFAV